MTDMDKNIPSMFVCPVCGEPLSEGEHTFSCPRGHSFDRARAGYVNLLRTQSGGKRHGDDKRMIRARTEFLETGLYRPLLDCIAGLAGKYAGTHVRLLDAGCGEGWYTEGLLRSLTEQGRSVEACGVDISRDALTAAGKRSRALHLAVASVGRLPVQNNWTNELINVFAPMEPKEFARVLAPDGVWIRAVPLEEHLFGLKALIYDTPYRNRVEPVEIEGWHCVEQAEVRYTLSIGDPSVIQSLFWMTPYAYKTSARDQEKLSALAHLETEAAFGVRVYRKS